MKTLITTFIFIGSFLALHAQDNIVFTNGDEVQAKVEEIGLTEVTYRKFDNLNGPLYRVDRNTIFIIQFENGTSELVTAINLNTLPVATTAARNGRQLVGSDYKSPGLAFLFSFLMPGGGQYYNHQFGKGGAMTGLWVGGLITSSTAPYDYNHYYEPYYYTDDYGNVIYDDYYYGTGRNPQRVVGNVVWTGSWIWSMIDAPISAARINRKNADASTAGVLDFRLNEGTTFHIEPFKSTGLGGALALRF